MQENGLIRGADGLDRCFWHGGLEDYRRYHDEEWGRPVTDDSRLFEKICLEGFQSGLSWLTILRKRENFRAAFAGFEIARVARFDASDIALLLEDKGIVRHKGKIVSTINNANRAIELIAEHGSLAAFFSGFRPAATERPEVIDIEWLRANPTSPSSIRLSKELKRRGWTFVGPTTIYSFMQAMGMVNDHLEGCYCRPAIEAERRVTEPVPAL